MHIVQGTLLRVGFSDQTVLSVHRRISSSTCVFLLFPKCLRGWLWAHQHRSGCAGREDRSLRRRLGASQVRRAAPVQHLRDDASRQLLGIGPAIPAASGRELRGEAEERLGKAQHIPCPWNLERRDGFRVRNPYHLVSVLGQSGRGYVHGFGGNHCGKRLTVSGMHVCAI